MSQGALFRYLYTEVLVSVCANSYVVFVRLEDLTP